jgi:cytochrome c oxidase subunit II
MALMRSMFAAAVWLAALGGVATAQLLPTEPFPWQMGMQESATEIMDFIIWMNWYTIIIGGLIMLLVLSLIGWCIVRYNREAHPNPSRVTHNTLVEVTWTVVPILILVAIAVPSFRLLYAQHDPARMYEDYRPGETPWLTVKVTGYQWFWSAEYGVDEHNETNGVIDDIRFDILMTPDEELVDGQPRLLTVDNPMVVPVDTFVRVLVTAGDVIHAFAMPAFGVKIDAVPGRINETYFRAYRTGIFYGQCSELCGKDHAYMPKVIKVVEQEHFRQWAAAAAEDLRGAYELLDRLIEADAGQRDEEQEVASLERAT